MSCLYGCTARILDGLMGLHIWVTQREINDIIKLLRHIEELSGQRRLDMLGDD
jgi:hypothetical protein